MVEKLRQLGLSPYEAKCYLALLKHGNLAGKEIAKKSTVPPTSVYRNLEALQRKGFVQVVQKEPLVYQAVNPEIAISTHLQHKRQQLEKLEQKTIKVLQNIKEQRMERKKEVLEIYSGRKQGYRIGTELIDDSRKEFLLIGSGSKQSILDTIHHLGVAVMRGVKCKYLLTAYGDNKKLVEELKKDGIKVKYYPLQNFSLLVKDRQESLIALKQVQERIVLHIKDKDLSQAQACYFDSVWRKATPV